MLALVVWSALAAEPVPRRGGGAPWVAVTEASVGRSARCEAVIQLDGGGRVVTVAASGCDDPWRAATEAAVASWRFERGTPDHVHSFDFAPAVVVRRSEQPLSLDEATLIHTVPRRLSADLDFSPPDAVVKTRCDAEFFVDGYGMTYAVDLSACPAEVRMLAELRLMRYRFAPELVPGRGLAPVRFRTHVKMR
jgi:hypothetical protein